jgi:hypothetical protein
MLTPMFVAPVTSWGRRLLAALRVAVCVVATAALSGCQQAASHEISHELLYILDTDRSRPDSHAQLLVLDPQRKAIVKRYQGAEPIDFALSADGKRLYLARSQETPHGVNGQLDVIDTVSGAVMATASNPDLWVAKGPYRNSEMAFSADGHWLYVYKLTPGPGNTVSENVAIFDTAVNRFLPDTISLSKCGASLLVLGRTPGHSRCFASLQRTCAPCNSAIKVSPRANCRSSPFLTIGGADAWEPHLFPARMK